VPPEIAHLLDSHQDLHGWEFVELHPEHPIRFDKRRGEPRNADVAARVRVPAGEVAVTVEAKADESFDRPIQEILADTVDALAHGSRTRIGARVQDLAASILPVKRAATARLGDLRYQLLTGVAGTIAHAETLNARQAVFIVHEFITDRTRDVLHDRNAVDLNAFVARLTDGEHVSLGAGQLIGPITLPSGPLWVSPARLYVGKAQRMLRRGAV
jgi:hypothetical protein